MKGNLTKSNQVQTGVNGNTSTNKTITAVAIERYLPGRLLKKGNLVRTTSTINVAEMTDSINHAV